MTAIAEKFIEYYWRQAKPYRAVDARGIVLKQNTGSQAAVVNALVEQQSRHGSLALARRDLEWDALVARVAGIVREMPL